jgi:hypothetical protein
MLVSTFYTTDKRHSQTADAQSKNVDTDQTGSITELIITAVIAGGNQ